MSPAGGLTSADRRPLAGGGLASAVMASTWPTYVGGGAWPRSPAPKGRGHPGRAAAEREQPGGQQSARLTAAEPHTPHTKALARPLPSNCMSRPRSASGRRYLTEARRKLVLRMAMVLVAAGARARGRPLTAGAAKRTVTGRCCVQSVAVVPSTLVLSEPGRPRRRRCRQPSDHRLKPARLRGSRRAGPVVQLAGRAAGRPSTPAERRTRRLPGCSHL